MAEKIDIKNENTWKDLYRIGGISSISVSFLVTLAIGAFFVWPYNVSDGDMREILLNLHKDRLGGLLSLDLLMLITLFTYLFTILALFVSLKKTNKSYALIALILGLIAITTVINSRPLIEMVSLSEKYATASTEIEKAITLNTSEVYRLLFDGTAWFIQTLLLAFSGLINSVIMLRNQFYSKKTAWLGVFASLTGLLFWIPKIGIGFLFLNTMLTIPWCSLVGLSLLKMVDKREV